MSVLPKYIGLSIVILFFLLSADTRGQVSFEIEGKINAGDGFIRLLPAIPPDSILSSLVAPQYSVPVHEGQFFIEGSITRPYPFYFEFQRGDSLVYSSHFFVLEKGKQSAKIDITSPISVVENATMKQFYTSSLFKDYVRLQETLIWQKSFSDSLATNYNNTSLQDSLRNVLQEIRKNQQVRSIEFQSRVANIRSSGMPWYSFWSIYVNFYRYGIQPGFEYYLRDSGLLETGDEVAIRLASQLNRVSVAGIGKPFPLEPIYLNLKTGTYERIKPGKSKYTLIDFWHSQCGFCIKQMLQIKPLYPSLLDNGLQFISISGDWSLYKSTLAKVRNKFKFPWDEYLDENRKVTTHFQINVYPANFLLDSSGTIIRKDVSVKELMELVLGKDWPGAASQDKFPDLHY